MKVDVTEFVATKIAFLRHNGSPATVLETAKQFIEWRRQQSLLSPVATSQTYGIAYDDPQTTKAEDFRFDICGSIESDVPENAQGVKAGIIPEGRCAVIQHLGSHDNMDDKIRYLYAEWLPSSGEQLRDFPCFFHYHNLIPFVQEHELITDIYLPIQ